MDPNMPDGPGGDDFSRLGDFSTRELLVELAQRMEKRGRPRSTPVAQLGRVCRSSLTVLLPAELDAYREVEPDRSLRERLKDI